MTIEEKQAELKELKAKAYDALAAREHYERELAKINQEIARVSQEIAKPSEIEALIEP